MDKEKLYKVILIILKKKEILPYPKTSMNFEDIMLNKAVTEGQILHDSTYMKYIK